MINNRYPGKKFFSFFSSLLLLAALLPLPILAVSYTLTYTAGSNGAIGGTTPKR